MLEILQYVLGDFWRFVGACVLTGIVLNGVANIVTAFFPKKYREDEEL